MYDFTDVTLETPFKEIPEGKYLVQAQDSLLKDTKTGTGKYISVKYRIMTGEFEGRNIWNNFNVENQNPEAVKIAKQTMVQFMSASGLPQNRWKLSSVTDLNGLTCGVYIKKDTNSTKTDAVKIVNFFPSTSLDATASTLGTALSSLPF